MRLSVSVYNERIKTANTEENDMEHKITKVEIYKHLWHPTFCAEVYVNNSSDAVVRFDSIDRSDMAKVSRFRSTLESRLAGVDHLVTMAEYSAANLLNELEKIKRELE